MKGKEGQGIYSSLLSSLLFAVLCLLIVFDACLHIDAACVDRTSHVHGKYDLLVWFEILELSPSGE